MKIKISLNNETWSLADELIFLYENYGQEEDDKLYGNAINLKNAINEIIEYLTDQGFIKYEKLESKDE